MLHVNLPFVHKLHKIFNILELDILQYDNWILFTVAVCENGVKVRAACGQYYSMCFKCLTIAGQRDITETSPVKQLRELCL